MSAIVNAVWKPAWLAVKVMMSARNNASVSINAIHMILIVDIRARAPKALFVLATRNRPNVLWNAFATSIANVATTVKIITLRILMLWQSVNFIATSRLVVAQPNAWPLLNKTENIVSKSVTKPKEINV